eukprot:CAMPEP_0197621842 /NCGR_PEP_ID=MMETSP1338-20131121/2280_1 /TAXON_ID=43686 ORGANISM="Pelagodinium beii, Strain RCC1491" /NCGR_SAMPLE_ID=MMETSP1338 /ASSEMBLY_ACC=CAM_ASM_000754 /LENGTH=1182 /DNA_ID=CAMNT_0043191393 /DNA_START=58 /DNA_END=3606 /DNA_ORIENTATION=-
MSDTSWACKTVEDCASPNWNHAIGQLMIAGYVLGFYFVVGYAWVFIAPYTTIDFRAIFSNYQHGLASSGTGAGYCLLILYIIQMFAFAHRSIVGYVDPLLHALEILGTLMFALDVSAKWGYVCCEGPLALTIYMFSGMAAVDVMSMTSTIAIAAVDLDGTGKRTWWSFAFLATFAIHRVNNSLRIFDGGKDLNAYTRQLTYCTVDVCNAVFAFSSIIMSLELLTAGKQTPPDADWTWTFDEGLFWAASVFMLLGDSARNARSAMGQLAASVCILIVCYQVFLRILPMLFGIVSGSKSYLGKYPYETRALRSTDGHMIILGSPNAMTLWSFLQEFYHPNHFSDGQDFEREARDCVIMLEDSFVLKYVDRLLKRDANKWRSKVFLLYGQAFNTNDLHRCCASMAKHVLILPDMTTPDMNTDDLKNIMRTYAMCSVSKTVKATCLVHSAEHEGSMLSGSTPNSVFVSIDAIKMSLLGKACMFPGAMTLISNLCISVGSSTVSLFEQRRHWLGDYERGLDMELYEELLSVAYHGSTFMEVFEDILMRSDGCVYLIGITDSADLGSARGKSRSGNEREVLINPGPDYFMSIAPGKTAGVFMAQDLGAIVQMKPGEDLDISKTKPPRRLPLFEKQQKEVIQEQNGEELAHESRLRPISAASQTSENGYFEGKAEEHLSKEKEKKLAELAVFADEEYDKQMAKLKRRFIERGMPPELAGGATNTKPFERRFPRTNVVYVEEEDSGSDPENEDETKKLLLGKLKRDNMNVFEKQRQELERLEATVERVRKDATGERKPARSMLAAGGHILLCLVGDTDVSSVGLGTTDLTGSMAGLSCFMKALRDERLELIDASQPPVLVLSEVQPSDWHVTVGMERVYYMRGSPLCVADLLKAGLRTARCAVIARTHNGNSWGVTKTTDSRIVLAATLCSSMLPQNVIIPIVTDHAFFGSSDLLPVERVFIEEAPILRAAAVGPPGRMPLAIMSLFKGWKELAKSNDLMGAPSRISDQSALDGMSPDDAYDELTKYDLKYHPRYLNGQIFHPSAVASMVANSMYNPSLITMVDALIQSPIMLVDVPKVWETARYHDFSIWLLRERSLMPLGIYRSAEASQAAHTGDYLDDSQPTHHFVYTAPPGSKTMLVRTDRIIVVAVGTKNSRPTGIGNHRHQAALKQAMTAVHKKAAAGGKTRMM